METKAEGFTYSEWASQIEDNLTYHDIRATLDGVEAGVISRSFTNKWLKRVGFKICWKTYTLTTLKVER